MAADYKDRILELRRVPADEIRVHPLNWRVHHSEQRQILESVLGKVGVADAAIGYDSKKYGGLTLIDGHLRREMLEELPVIVLDVNDEEAELLLASHDPIAEMAVTNDAKLEELLAKIPSAEETLRGLFPDATDSWEKITAEVTEKPKYPLAPHFDEAYDAVIIFSKREIDWAWLTTVLGLKRKESKGTIGLCRVLTVEEFKEKWEGREGS